MEWKVVYQATPYNFTTPQTLIISADSREQALVAVYDRLTRQGHAISVDSVAYDLKADGINWDTARGLGWPSGPTMGSMHIRSLEAHGIQNAPTGITETITLTQDQWTEVRVALRLAAERSRDPQLKHRREAIYELIVTQGADQATTRTMDTQRLQRANLLLHDMWSMLERETTARRPHGYGVIQRRFSDHLQVKGWTHAQGETDAAARAKRDAEIDESYRDAMKTAPLSDMGDNDSRREG